LYIQIPYDRFVQRVASFHRAFRTTPTRVFDVIVFLLLNDITGTAERAGVALSTIYSTRQITG
jgi:hypothetical protein